LKLFRLARLRQQYLKIYKNDKERTKDKRRSREKRTTMEDDINIPSRRGEAESNEHARRERNNVFKRRRNAMYEKVVVASWLHKQVKDSVMYLAQ
jgi:hypothetical protein